MAGLPLGIIKSTLVQCIKDIAVLKRFETDGQYFEVNDIQKENNRWIVIATGIDESEANKLFSGSPNREMKALIPLQYKSNCTISMLFIMRPIDNDVSSASETRCVSPFAPLKGIPFVEMLHSYVKVSQIPSNVNQLNNLRWEWDVIQSLNPPIEKWLRNWKDDCGFNPAHPPSHLHLNTESLDLTGKKSQRPGDTENDLRLAIGNPNPLALLLSIAVWLRRL